jgi:hypothetical protein
MVINPGKAAAAIGSQEQILAWDAEAEDHFGSSVGISNGVVIVGAPWKNNGADTQSGAAYLFQSSGTNTWVSLFRANRLDTMSINPFDHFGKSVAISNGYAIIGSEVDGPGTNPGAAYIVATGSPDATKIIASDAEAGDFFGESVAISGDYAIVGASMEGTLDNGAAYIFQRTIGNNWNLGVKITDPIGASYDHFGSSVAISGDYVIVGSPDADQGGDNYAGAAVIFNRQVADGPWTPNTKKFSPYPQAESFFGCSVGISGDYAIVGAYGDDEAGDRAGAAYIFMREGADWIDVYQLVASDAQVNDGFGFSVAIDGDFAIVGAPWEDSGGDGAGAVYIFKRTDTNTWDSGTKVMAPDAEAGDHYGESVAISGDYAVVGARYNDAGGTNAGAAYVIYDLDAPPASDDDSDSGDGGGGCFITTLMNP